MLISQTLTLIGDLQVELTTNLKDARFSHLIKDSLIYSDIDIRVGGTAANFALAAAQHFKTVNVLGQLGDDAFGRLVRTTLVQQGIHLHCEPIGDLTTAVAIHARDASKVSAHGVRLLIVDRGANPRLDIATVNHRGALIAQSDLFYSDGYCLMEEPRRSATLHAMTLARAHNVIVAFDLVPHHAHLHFRFDDLTRWIELVDILITEVRTIRAVLGFPWEDEVLDRQTAYETWSIFERRFPGKDVYLQFGAGNVDESLLCHAGDVPKWRPNGYLGASEPRGFGDRLAAADLAAYLAKCRRAASSS